MSEPEQTEDEFLKVPQGTWLRPLNGYDSVPYEFNRPGYKAKGFSLFFQDLGEIGVEVIRDRVEIEPDPNENSLYFDGHDERLIENSLDRYSQIEKDNELPLVDVGSTYDGDNTVLQRILLPNGTILERREGPENHLNLWIKVQTGEQIRRLLIPETQFILSEIAFTAINTPNDE